jgi:H+/Cl- antiporter ClcA
MRSVYKFLAYAIPVLVAVQAAAIAFAFFGLSKWIDDGGTMDKAAMESDNTSFTGVAGFMVHGINGMMIIPLLGLALLVVSFFAKVPGGVKLAAIVLGSIVVQVFAGILGHDAPYIGMIHGLNAFVLFSAAVYAARLARTAGAETPSTPVAA